jgi:hypothetical protein
MQTILEHIKLAQNVVVGLFFLQLSWIYKQPYASPVSFGISYLKRDLR